MLCIQGLLPSTLVQLCTMPTPWSHAWRRQEVACPLSQNTMVRCTVSSHLDNQGTTTALTLHSRHHHYGDDHCCEGQHSTKESRREIMGLGREKHSLPWQANTGLSSFPKYARHIANPRVKSATTASPPELSVEEEPWCAGGATVYFTRVKPRLGHVC